MDELLLKLLNALEAIAETNEELFDTECRERMGDLVFHIFVKPEESYEASTDFGLFGDEANSRVRTALLAYTSSASAEAKRIGLDTFHSRLAAFQNGDVVSGSGANYYDDFFGWMNPDDYDETGNPTHNRG